MKVKLSASHPHPEDLDSGRQLAPGEVVDVPKGELDGERAEALIATEVLFVLDDPGEGKLTGEALDRRAAELELEGRSEMTADEKRAAIAKAEADQADTNQEA